MSSLYNHAYNNTNINATTQQFQNNSVQLKAFEWLLTHEGAIDIFRDDERILQRFILAVLYFSTSGPNWKEQYRFLSREHECLWLVSGIACDSNEAITELEIGSNGLEGSIPTEVASLTNLVRIALQGNSLSGPVPSQLPQLVKLREFDVSENSLTGTIPLSLSNMTWLERLILTKNNLNGTIPSEVGLMQNLTWLEFESNDLVGPIPLELFNALTHLKGLRLGQNALDGPLHSEIAQLSGLINFGINTNEISGTIPTEIGTLTLLTNLQLPDTKLTGTIPSELGNLGRVAKLAMSYCNLTGTIPLTFARLTSLTKLYLQGNPHLTGDMNFMCSPPLLPMDPMRIDRPAATCDCCTCCP